VHLQVLQDDVVSPKHLDADAVEFAQSVETDDGDVAHVLHVNLGQRGRVGQRDGAVDVDGERLRALVANSGLQRRAGVHRDGGAARAAGGAGGHRGVAKQAESGARRLGSG